MNILIVTDSFLPEIKSSANLLFELSEDLVESGHQVTVVTGFPKHYINNIDQRYKSKLFLRERMNKIKVMRLLSISFIRHIPVIGGLDQFLLSVMFFLGGINSGKPDVILTYSPPLPFYPTVITLRVGSNILSGASPKKILNCVSMLNKKRTRKIPLVMAVPVMKL